MVEQYWIDDYFVDLSRNQITQNKKSQTIAPKALAVLTCLAENQGKVVSQAVLLDKVWQNTSVTPNTLQRSIAQLRKALGDDGKVQHYIKTHAKQGYSLECKVRWHDDADLKEVGSSHESIGSDSLDGNGTNSNDKQKSIGFNIVPFAVTAIFIVLVFLGYKYISNKRSSTLTFDTLRSLTATDDKEFDATYSPDGQYIVFHRYLDKQCVNSLWAKDIRTQRETRLTSDWGNYGGHSFSKDGEKLVFLATEACSKPYCYNLVSLDFQKALESPQQPSLMLQCKNSEIKKPTWLNNNSIALMQKNSNRWKLIRYSVSENQSTDLYHPNEGNLIDFTYSVRNNLIAVISIHDDGKHYIEMLKPDGRMLSSHQIKRPPEIPEFRPIYPNFDPLNEQLVFSTGRQLFTLSYDGNVSKINLPFADRMMLPEFHPDGRRLLLIKGPYDSDIVLLPRPQTPTDPSSQTGQAQLRQTRTYPSFERSNLGEDHAIFQPGGELIAFWSDRSGEEQLWISDGHGPHQLTHFPIDTYIRGIDWAEDGQSLLVNANSVLTQVSLDANQRPFPLEHPVVQLFHWDSENNSVLLLASIKGIQKLVAVDLNNLEIQEITEKRVKWALKSEDGRIIFKDHLDQFWQPGPAEAQHIQSLDTKGNKADPFLIKDNVVYAVNSEGQLWSYDLNSEVFQVLGDLGGDVDYLTDLNQTQLLMTIQVAAKKEVVELSVSE